MMAEESVGVSRKAAETLEIRVDSDRVVQKERAVLGKPGEEELIALALSGGGIRSASFALGVMQALVCAGIMKKFDYLSSASGGGYIASSLTWFLRQGLPDGRKAGTESGNFPFGIRGKGLRMQDGGTARHSNMLLDYLRQHSRYLTPGKGLDGAALLGFALRNVAVSLLLHFGLVLLLVIGLLWSGAYSKISLTDSVQISVLQGMALLALVVFGVSSLGFAVTTSLPGKLWGLRYRIRLASQKFLGLLLKALAIFLVLASLEPVHVWLKHFLSHPIHLAGVSTTTGMILGLLQRHLRDNGKASVWLAFIASSLVLYGLLLGAYALFAEAYNRAMLTELYLFTAVLLALSAIVNSNYFSIHRMYRDRLMEAFMPDPDKILHNEWGKAVEADNGQLRDMCDPAVNLRPYHLINANVVLVNSNTSRYQARGGDSFLLSPLFCGSDATGYIPTHDWKVNADKSISLATAMATSGASFNPNAGNSGRGITRSSLVSGLLSVLNMRLGQWVSNPGRQNLWFQQPNFITTGLFGSFFGTRHDEHSRMLELTDGGHFDNLALYELIRRQVSLILLSDAGADPRCSFDDLGNVVERVRVDFGVKIRFDDPVFDLDGLHPGSAENMPMVAERYGLSDHAFALARIDYPDGKCGTLIYLKAAMLKNLPADLYSYKVAHPAFPHEPTLDQFFDEVQFEAYRELGYQLTWTMLNQYGRYDAGNWIPLPDGALGLLAERDKERDADL